MAGTSSTKSRTNNHASIDTRQSPTATAGASIRFDSSHSDEEIMAAFSRTQNQQFFDELYRRYVDPLLTFLIKYLNNDEAAAEDCLQQTFLKVYTAHDQYDPTRKFRPWVYTIAGNLAITMIRAEGRRFAHSMDDFQISDHGEPRYGYDPVDYRTRDVTEAAESQEMSEHLVALLNSLSDTDREALRLTYFEGLTYNEAAVRLGIPFGSLCTRINRGLKKLRSTLGRDDLFKRAA
jgi:RNA polymerase sigma-70 factor (ECF subfamily)